MQAVAVVRKLNTGDKVLVDNEYGNLRDSGSELLTQFIGILLEDPEVIFNVHRETNFTGKGIITYSGIDVNLGNGMSASDGIFTAPISGTYYFHFQGVSDHNSYVNIYHNGGLIASSFKYELPGAFGMQTISVISQLNKGDKIHVLNSNTVLRNINSEKKCL